MGVDRSVRVPVLPSQSFSPHAWGWTVFSKVEGYDYYVFPTRVGVDLKENQLGCECHRFPHTRGGGPAVRAFLWMVTVVFPTRVGVDRVSRAAACVDGCFPHTRGGGPIGLALPDDVRTFSPHAWGWTEFTSFTVRYYTVFPTRVGVDRRYRQSWAP